MRVFKWGAAGAIAVSMVASSAFAAESTRSATALPTAQSAPVNGVRTSTSLKRTSSQSDEGSPVLGYVLEAAVAAGIVAATIVATNDDSHHAMSGG